MDSKAHPTTYLDLAGEVEIPPEGTLSRVLYSDDQLRLVIFAFDKGQELTDHAAGVAAVVQMVSGTIRLNLDGEEKVLGPRSWVHMPAGLPHAVLALEPSVMILSLLKSG